MPSSYHGFSRFPKPPPGQRLVPPIFGTWRVGPVVMAVRPGTLRPIGLHDPLFSGETVLPPGLHVEFKPDYDPVAREALSVMTLLPPFPPDSCTYQKLQYYYDEYGGLKVPSQRPIRWEFALDFTREAIEETFAPLGATAKDICFRIYGSGRTWYGNFYVAKDRQTMWTDVYPGAAYILDTDGVKRDVPPTTQLWQVYHRVPSPTRY